MTASVELIDPTKIHPNPDNPRLIFRRKELEELEESIASQGILVPLTVYSDKRQFVLLDGERRWRCARKLGLHTVPAIVQRKPERMQNIMMMFAIHNARRDWDPLPTALKLQELEHELTKARERKLTESELAAAASISRGAVRRYRKILRIPKDIQDDLLRDLEDPTNKQSISVDQVIEAVDAAQDLREAKIVEDDEERNVIDSVVEKFRSGIIKNTVEPRKLGKIARAVRDGRLLPRPARKAILRFCRTKSVTIENVVSETIEEIEYKQSLDRGLRSFEEKWLADIEAHSSLMPEFRERIRVVIARLRALL
jgi:ParB family transcriptional regulator, chromosome partitioning protein